MFFLSQVLGRPIRDMHGERIATVRDLIVRIDDKPYPTVTGLVARQGRRQFFIKASQISSLDESGAELSTTRLNLERFSRRENEVLLSKHVLDRQLIDVDGRRVIRVNDLQLAPSPSGYRVIAVDVSPHGLLRRLGVRRLGTPGPLLDWADVEYFASDAPAVRLKVSHERLSRLHPTDIARLVESVSYQKGAEILESLDVETAADAMEEVSDERQASLVGGMDEERAADIIERMAPDDAADLLADLDEEKQRDLLRLMEAEASLDVEELLAYPEDSAGGLMTPNYVPALPNMTVEQAIEHARALPYEPELVYYFYVVDSLEEEQPVLLGIASLRDMIFAGLSRRMDEVMTREFYHASSETSSDEVARVIGEYNLLALPVLSEDGRLLGIVTVDDVMERLLPVPWRQRLPRLFR